MKTMAEHEHFDELCTLVASGLASVDEFRELQNHLQDCAECRNSYGDFAHLGAGILSVENHWKRRPPAGMTERFVARAIAEGIPLRQPVKFFPAWASRHSLVWTGAIAAGMVIAVFAIGNLRRLTNSVPSYHNEATMDSSVSGATTGPTATGGAVAVDRSSSEDAIKRLQATLNAVNADKQDLVGSLAELNDQIKTKTVHDGDLTAQIAELQSQLDQLKQQSTAKDAQIAELSSEQKQNEARNASQLASMVDSQFQLRKLNSQLTERETALQDQRQMMAAGSQARDMIVARNLHIIDVHDNNGEGQRQRAFGRIFFTEGKQIVFYAYDLNNASRLKEQVAFYVWGGKLSNEHAVKNLGIFRSEDAEAGRWVLTFDDPHVLAEINTVFVTAESKKNVEHPDGKPILFAYLGDKANHP
jgi:hypothetical protein